MCSIHRVTKRLLKRSQEPLGVRFVDVTADDVSECGTVLIRRLSPTDQHQDGNDEVPLDQLYPVENGGPLGANLHLRTSFESHAGHGSSQVERFAPAVWRKFIDAAEIPIGYRNSGLKYAGYIESGRNSWCLPSWIWTNAAIVRYLCSADELEQASRIGDLLLGRQEAEGGWIVRSDYTPTDEVPVLAPNDSAYIANNALLELYARTGEAKYLNSAIRCADWIMESSRPDGLVWTGCNRNTGEWLSKYTIVDTGFTAGLFANLYMTTGEPRYRKFLERFVVRFIELFYNPRTQGFATSVDQVGKKIGGRFARGQAWALEGLVPAYRALRTESLGEVIKATVNSLLKEQLANGGWAYNFDRAFFGEDCKGVPVIAKALLEWHDVHPDVRLPMSARRALTWCEKHTSLSGPALGGIFSFNLEGAVVHNLYTATAFVYSSAYALEAAEMLLSHE
jgi:hypothetical protein